MLQKVKLALRITNTIFDDEISDIIEACKLDMQLSGIEVDDQDTLIQRAIILYSKAQFGLENKDSDKYQKSYEALKTHLALSGEYLS